MVRFRWLLLASLPALALGRPAHAQPAPLGPLTAEEGTPLQRLALTPTFEIADPVPRGSWSTDAWLGYSNIFEQDSTDAHNLYLDMERLITALTVRYGVAEGLEVGARVTLETTWGGFLDGFMEGFHNTLRLGNRNRPDFPKGAYGQRLTDGDGQVLVDVPRRNLALDGLRLFAKWGAFGRIGSTRALSVRLTARVPTAENRVGQERADLGITLLGRTGWGRAHVHAVAGGTTVRRSPELEDVLTERQWFAGVGLEYPFRAGLSGVIEWMGSTQLLRSFDDHDVDGAPTNVVLGFVGELDSGWRWQVGLQEDAPPRGPSLDFTFQLGLSRRW